MRLRKLPTGQLIITPLQSGSFAKMIHRIIFKRSAQVLVEIHCFGVKFGLILRAITASLQVLIKPKTTIIVIICRYISDYDASGTETL